MRWRVLAGLLLVLVTGWLLAGAAATTFARTDSATYPVSFAGASWIQAPSGASHAYFRLPLELTATPDLATLWIDANQQYRVYANGEDVAGSESPVQSGRPQLADPVDLSWRLRKGSNAIGVRVVDGDVAVALEPMAATTVSPVPAAPIEVPSKVPSTRGPGDGPAIGPDENVPAVAT